MATRRNSRIEGVIGNRYRSFLLACPRNGWGDDWRHCRRRRCCYEMDPVMKNHGINQATIERLARQGRVKEWTRRTPAVLGYTIHADLPPSVNHYTRASKSGGRILTERAKEYKTSLGNLAKDKGVVMVDYAVSVAIVLVAEPEKMDVDNCAKVLLDSLQGVCFRNDSLVWKLSIERRMPADLERRHVEITIEKYQ